MGPETSADPTSDLFYRAPIQPLKMVFDCLVVVFKDFGGLQDAPDYLTDRP